MNDHFYSSPVLYCGKNERSRLHVTSMYDEGNKMPKMGRLLHKQTLAESPGQISNVKKL